MNNVETDNLKEVFDSFDKNGSGKVDMFRLREILQAMGQEPTDEELFTMIAGADLDSDGTLTFEDLMKIIAKQKKGSGETEDDQDTYNAWIALGGDADKSGKVPVELIKATVKEFKLKVNVDAILKAQIEQRISATLAAHSRKQKIIVPEELDYDEFRQLLAQKRPELPFM